MFGNQTADDSQWKSMTNIHFWLPTFIKIFYFVFNTRKKLLQVWNNLSMSKWWQNLNFGGNGPFKTIKQ